MATADFNKLDPRKGGAGVSASALELLARATRRLSVSSARLAAGAATLAASDLATMETEVRELVTGIAAAKDAVTTERAPLKPPGSSHGELQGSAKHPFFERLAEVGSIEHLAGDHREPPIVLPVELSLVPDAVSSLAGVSNALQHCVHACTVLANQRGLVQNTYAVRVSLVSHLFLRVLPIPLPRRRVAEGKATCFWQTHAPSLTHDTQAEILRWLSLLCRHFAAASLALPLSASSDAARTLTFGAMAAVADAVVRIAACDAPSQFSLHYSGAAEGPAAPFALEMRHFERESARAQLLQPQYAAARTMLLDYFGDLARSVPEKRLLFRFERSMGIGPGEEALITQINLQLGFPTERRVLLLYLSGEEPELLDLYPEMATFRDIVFYFKAMMVPSSDALPDLRAWAPADAKLSWAWKKDDAGGAFAVKGFGATLHCGGWLGDADDDGVPQSKPGFFTKLFGKAPKPRLPPSAADASALIGSPVASEDDVLHVRHLPDFDGLLRASDAEMLLQTLLVPYLRVPLLLHFFAQPSHTPALACVELQQLLDAALFEPGAWQPDAPKAMPKTVPAETRDHLATPVGLLCQELTHSPVLLLASLQSLLDNALDLDAGRYTGGGSSEVILYALRLALRVEQYARFLLSDDARKVRGLDAAKAGGSARAPLEAGVAALRAKMAEHALPVLQGWYARWRRGATARSRTRAWSPPTSRTSTPACRRPSSTRARSSR